MLTSKEILHDIAYLHNGHIERLGRPDIDAPITYHVRVPEYIEDHEWYCSQLFEYLKRNGFEEIEPLSYRRGEMIFIFVDHENESE